jgi:hypothetical protein
LEPDIGGKIGVATNEIATDVRKEMGWRSRRGEPNSSRILGI